MLARSSYTNKFLPAGAPEALGRAEEFILLFPSLADERAGLTGVLLGKACSGSACSGATVLLPAPGLGMCWGRLLPMKGLGVSRGGLVFAGITAGSSPARPGRRYRSQNRANPVPALPSRGMKIAAQLWTFAGDG